MAGRVASEARRLYLVEHYRPGMQVDGLAGSAASVCEAAAELELEGKPIGYLRSTIVPSDESLLCLFEAASEELVREAYARAGVGFDRITGALDGPPPRGKHAPPIRNLLKEERT